MIIFEIQRVKIFSVTNFTNLKRKNTHYKDTIKLMLFGPIDSLPGQNTNMIFNLYLHCIMLNFSDIINSTLGIFGIDDNDTIYQKLYSCK